MQIELRVVDHLGKEVIPDPFTEVAVTEVISVSFWPNTDPEDDSPSRTVLTVRVAG